MKGMRCTGSHGPRRRYTRVNHTRWQFWYPHLCEACTVFFLQASHNPFLVTSSGLCSISEEPVGITAVTMRDCPGVQWLTR